MAVAISDRLLRLVVSESPVVVLTGAGVSAESGLATFRGPDGLWEGHDPTSLATPQAFAADPEMVWRFYDWRRKQAARAEPNAGHRALARWEASHPDFRLVTQNVDGLHERAGSKAPLRLHGSLWRLRCTASGEEFEDTRVDLGPLPPKSASGALLRPAVVWFGEGLDPAVLEDAVAACERAACVVVAGTSSLVHPAASLPLVAKRNGAYVVEINPEETPLTAEADEHLAGPAATLLPLLTEARR